MRFVASQADLEENPAGRHEALAVDSLANTCLENRQVTRLMAAEPDDDRPAVQLSILELFVGNRLDCLPQVTKLEIVHRREFET